MKQTIALILAGLCLFATAEARIPEPANMPAEISELNAHHPLVVRCYVDDFVAKGQMTRAEADNTVAYMLYRYERRQEDLAAVSGMDREARRAYRREKRKERGNPLVEYAAWLDVSLERAAELTNLMHENPKGDKYLHRMEEPEVYH